MTKEAAVDQLVEYLLSNLQLDFSGDVTAERLREFLREDDGVEARALLSRILDDSSADDLLITLADCLKDYITEGVSSVKVREQLRLYMES